MPTFSRLTRPRVAPLMAPLVVALLFIPALPTPSFAQPTAIERTAAPAPTPAPKPQPRLLSPEDKRVAAAEAGKAQSLPRPVPQLRIPLGPRAAAEGEPVRTTGRRATAAAPAGRVDDEAARCLAQASGDGAEACRLLTATPEAKRRPG